MASFRAAVNTDGPYFDSRIPDSKKARQKQAITDYEACLAAHKLMHHGLQP